jgi:hypothetical protein
MSSWYQGKQSNQDIQDQPVDLARYSSTLGRRYEWDCCSGLLHPGMSVSSPRDEMIESIRELLMLLSHYHADVNVNVTVQTR